MRICSFSVVALLLAGVLGVPEMPAVFAASVAWDPPVLIDGGGDIANSLSIAFDSTSHPHIASVDFSSGGILLYAHFDGAVWRVESFHNVAVTHPQSKTSLRVDSSGYPHIVVAGGSGPDYIYKDASGWHSEDIDNIYYSPSLRIGTDGVARVVYWTWTGGPVERSYRYAKRIGGVWQKETIASFDSQIGECSLALDDANQPMVAYLKQSTLDLCWAVKSAPSGPWMNYTLDGGADDSGRYNDIEFDSSNIPHILYADLTGDRIVHACRPAGTWMFEAVVNGVEPQGLDLDISPSGTIGLGFATANTLYYCRKLADVWSASSTAYDGVHLAFAFDGVGSPRFATARNATGLAALPESDLLYTSCTGGAFVSEVVDGEGLAPYATVGGSKNGEWVIYGVGRSSSDLVTRTGRLPSNLVVAGPNGGSYADIEPGVWGAMFGVYYGGNPPGTWFAESAQLPTSAASWTHTLIEAGTGVAGAGSTLAISPWTGEPCIAYRNNTGLVYAWRDDGVWRSRQIDTGTFRPEMSLDLGEFAFPRIAYYDKGSGDLKLVRKTGAAEDDWTTETLDAGGDVGQRPALAVGGDPEMSHIAYQDYGNKRLKYARHRPGLVQIVTVDWNDAGHTTGIALDSTLQPHIAYEGSGSLKYAWNTGAGWLISTVAPSVKRSDTIPISVSGNRVTIYYGDASLGAVMKVQGWFDYTPPSQPQVQDDGDWTTSATQLHASWISEEPETGIAEFQYAIGTSPYDPGSGYVVDWTSVGESTDVTRTGLSLTNGARYYFYVRARNRAGEWSEVGVSDGIRVVEMVYRIADAKLLPDDTWVYLSGKVITRDSTPYYFLIQEPDRSCGITVYASKGDMPGCTALLKGYTVIVVGRMGHISGRRCILDPTLARPVSNVGLPEPLRIRCAGVGGGPFAYDAGPPEVGERGCPWSYGLNNVGLFVFTSGRVGESVPDESFTINDGSLPGRDLTVIVEAGWLLPKRDAYVTVQGHAELDGLKLTHAHAWEEIR